MNAEYCWERLKSDLERMTDETMESIRRNHDGSLAYSAKQEHALKQLIYIRAHMVQLEKENPA